MRAVWCIQIARMRHRYLFLFLLLLLQPLFGQSHTSATNPSAHPPLSGRLRIGVALGGGGALGLAHIGVLQWFEDNHIPVDALAGTSMGALVGGLYASGRSTDELQSVVSEDVFMNVFRLQIAYSALNYRRRQDPSSLPQFIDTRPARRHQHAQQPAD